MPSLQIWVPLYVRPNLLHIRPPKKGLASEYAQPEGTSFLVWLSLNLMYFLVECFIFLQETNIRLTIIFTFFFLLPQHHLYYSCLSIASICYCYCYRILVVALHWLRFRRRHKFTATSAESVSTRPRGRPVGFTARTRQEQQFEASTQPLPSQFERVEKALSQQTQVAGV